MSQQENKIPLNSSNSNEKHSQSTLLQPLPPQQSTDQSSQRPIPQASQQGIQKEEAKKTPTNKRGFMCCCTTGKQKDKGDQQNVAKPIEKPQIAQPRQLEIVRDSQKRDSVKSVKEEEKKYEASQTKEAAINIEQFDPALRNSERKDLLSSVVADQTSPAIKISPEAQQSPETMIKQTQGVSPQVGPSQSNKAEPGTATSRENQEIRGGEAGKKLLVAHFQLQANEAIDVDDIDCDLDEEMEDERISVVQDDGGIGANERRQSQVVNDSFIANKFRDFSSVNPRSNIIPKMNSSRIGPNKGNNSFVVIGTVQLPVHASGNPQLLPQTKPHIGAIKSSSFVHHTHQKQSEGLKLDIQITKEGEQNPNDISYPVIIQSESPKNMRPSNGISGESDSKPVSQSHATALVLQAPQVDSSLAQSKYLVGKPLQGAQPLPPVAASQLMNGQILPKLSAFGGDNFHPGELLSNTDSAQSSGSYDPHLLRHSGLTTSNEEQKSSTSTVTMTAQISSQLRQNNAILSVSHASDKEAGASTTMSSTNQRLAKNPPGHIMEDIERIIQQSAREHTQEHATITKSKSAQPGTDPMLQIQFFSTLLAENKEKVQEQQMKILRIKHKIRQTHHKQIKLGHKLRETKEDNFILQTFMNNIVQQKLLMQVDSQ
ncbi:hypothetical protein FGO68_gene9296 [Halteria grandinella]|uniref:Uncharacterized protein n=1 Tax=Halteria grandinella TaxID=5974 RepID=A0A8J8NWE1_HALGN|nr:hypothetical protein FGO68_gene9296 [Halteria grandinella]